MEIACDWLVDPGQHISPLPQLTLQLVAMMVGGTSGVDTCIRTTNNDCFQLFDRRLVRRDVVLLLAQRGLDRVDSLPVARDGGEIAQPLHAHDWLVRLAVRVEREDSLR